MVTAISQNMKTQQNGEMNPLAVTSNPDFIRKVDKVECVPSRVECVPSIVPGARQ